MDFDKSIDEDLAEFERKRAERRESAARRAHIVPVVERMTVRIDVVNVGNEAVVHLYLNLTQEERAIVAHYALDAIVFDNDPFYGEDEIKAYIIWMDEYGADIRQAIKYWSTESEADDADERAERDKESYREWLEEKKDDLAMIHATKIPYTLIDYLEYPFFRICATRNDALRYADKLRTIIGKIAETINKYKAASNNER